MNASWIKPFFIIAGLYDVALGIAFLLFSSIVFRSFNVEPPNHPAYVQFPALLLLVFGVMFFNIARDPIKNRDLILYGIALKVAYCGTTFWYEFTQGIPFMWVPWAWADFAFLLIFLFAWNQLGSMKPRAS